MHNAISTMKTEWNVIVIFFRVITVVLRWNEREE